MMARTSCKPYNRHDTKHNANNSLLYYFIPLLTQAFAFSDLTLLDIRRRIWAIKNVQRGAGVVICLEQGANDLHMVKLMPLPPHHFLLS